MAFFPGGPGRRRQGRAGGLDRGGHPPGCDGGDRGPRTALLHRDRDPRRCPAPRPPPSAGDGRTTLRGPVPRTSRDRHTLHAQPRQRHITPVRRRSYSRPRAGPNRLARAGAHVGSGAAARLMSGGRLVRMWYSSSRRATSPRRPECRLAQQQTTALFALRAPPVGTDPPPAERSHPRCRQAAAGEPAAPHPARNAGRTGARTRVPAIVMALRLEPGAAPSAPSQGQSESDRIPGRR